MTNAELEKRRLKMRPMTNYDANVEFLKESMLEKGYAQFGIHDLTGQIKLCDEMGCSECKFKDPERSCREQRSEWLKQEAKPPISEQLVDTIREAVIECSDISCGDCVYYNLNELYHQRESCISGRITDAIRSKFNITVKEDK